MKAGEYLKLRNGLEGVVKKLNEDQSILGRILGNEYHMKIDGYTINLIRRSRHSHGIYMAEIRDEWISHERSSAEDSEKLVCALHPNYKKVGAAVERFLHEFSHSTGVRYDVFYGVFGHGNQKPIAPEILLNTA